MKNRKILIISIIIPLVAGIIGNFLGNPIGFEEIKKPAFSPPGIVFPIIWTILYILMGISSYLIYTSNNKNKEKSLKIYTVQLIFNTLWTFIFFNKKLYLLSFIWILVLIILILKMIISFKKINKTAAYLQIPYLLWLIFASILNLSIYLIN